MLPAMRGQSSEVRRATSAVEAMSARLRSLHREDEGDRSAFLGGGGYLFTLLIGGPMGKSVRSGEKDEGKY